MHTPSLIDSRSRQCVVSLFFAGCLGSYESLGQMSTLGLCEAGEGKRDKNKARTGDLENQVKNMCVKFHYLTVKVAVRNGTNVDGIRVQGQYLIVVVEV